MENRIKRALFGLLFEEFVLAYRSQRGATKLPVQIHAFSHTLISKLLINSQDSATKCSSRLKDKTTTSCDVKYGTTAYYMGDRSVF